MSTNPTQSHRAAELTTPLGTDKLVLSAFHVHEELSRPFEIGISCISPDENLDFGPALGKHCVIRYTTVGKKKRYFSGILVEASWKGERDRGFDYELVLRPWLWLLTQTSDSRIFQNKPVPEIIKDVFNRAGFSDYEMSLHESYPKVEYCVQYRETHFDFVSRLMEEHGIYYYFKHSDSKHVLVMSDTKQSHDPVPDLPTCRYVGMSERARDDEEYVKTWLTGRTFRTGKVTINAFDFDKPTANLLHEQLSPGGYMHDKLEHYVYPYKYKKGQEGDLGEKYARAWLHATQAQDRRRMASGEAASLFPGGLVKLKDHPTASENIEYLV
ncbi:MAG: type VI secretion system Vgr family protein, partial [Beijerinckiaceae bacterium]